VWHSRFEGALHARKLADTWEDIFGVDPKDLAYDLYRRMAVCNLPLAEKNRLRKLPGTCAPKFFL
jgi:hypothetical protein